MQLKENYFIRGQHSLSSVGLRDQTNLNVGGIIVPFFC